MLTLNYVSQAAFSTCVYGVIYCAWWRWLQRRETVRAGIALQMLLAATLMWTQIFSVILVLGLTGVLHRSLVLGINAAITAGLLWMTRRPAQAPSIVPHLRDLFSAAPFPILAGTVIFGWFAVLNVIYPTGSYDDFVYHIPSAAYFVQHHSFRIVEVASVQSGINYATKLSELFCVWQYFLTRDDELIDFWALGMFLQYVVAAYGLCRELGASRQGTAFGTLLSATAPVLLFQTLSAQNDLPMCAFFATALHFAVARDRGTSQRLGLALSMGLLLSSKLTAPLLCAIVFAAFWIAESKQPGKFRFVSTARKAAWISAIAVVLGGWWYLRNLHEFRNPFYPFRAQIAGFGLPGPATSTGEMQVLNKELAALPLPVRLWRLWREEKSHFGYWLYNTDSAYSGFGPGFFVLGLPSLAIALILTLLDRRWLAASVIWMIAIAYLIFPGNIAPRLSLFILLGEAVAIAIILTAIEQVSRVYTAGLRLLVLGLTTYTFLAAAMSPYDPLSIRKQILSPRQKDLAEGSFPALFGNVRTAIPRNATVAYDSSTTFIWPLWGPDWANKLEFCPASSAGWESWSAKAATLGVTHVVIGRPATSRMEGWIAEHPEHFHLVADGQFGALYAYRR